jgi:hypothetical protein
VHLEAIGRLRLARFQHAIRAGNVIEIELERVLADRPAVCRPRAEAQAAGVAGERTPPQEPDLRVEVLSNGQVLEPGAVAIPVVIELAAIAGALLQRAAAPCRVRPGDKARDGHVLEEPEVGVYAKDGVRWPFPRRTVRGNQADVAAAQHVAPQPHDRKVRRRGKAVVCFTRLHVQQADPELADPPCQPSSGDNRHFPAILEADAPAVEDDGRGIAAALLAAKVEQPLAFEEELALLGEEQAEAREIDLLLVLLHLREVRAEGEIGYETLRDAVLHVEPGVRQRIVAERRRGRQVRRRRGNRVRLDVDRGTLAWRFDTNQRREEVVAIHRADA